MRSREQNQHFLELVEARCRTHLDLFERVSRPDFGYGSERQVLRKDAVHAGSHHTFAHGNVLVVAHVVELEPRPARAFGRSLRAGIDEHRAGAAILIREQQDLRSGRIHLNHFSHRSLGSNHAHVRLDAIALPAVEINRAARSGVAADDARGQHGDVGMSFVELEQGFEPECFRGAAFQLAVPQREFPHLGAQLLVVAVGAEQADVTRPGPAQPVERPRASTFGGSQ